MTKADERSGTSRHDRGVGRDRTTDREPGPYESWLIGFLDEALARACSATTCVTVNSVDVMSPSKLGEVRAHVTFSGPVGGGAGSDKAAWKRLAAALGAHPLIRRVVAVPPTLYVTLDSRAVEVGLDRAVQADVLIPRRPDAPGVVVVFCSPNTNKPLHIGHLRACFLGMSIYRLVRATGAAAQRSQMLSNFGIHMCQAHVMYDDTLTPASAGVKGDHFVGGLYRAFHETVCSTDTACAPDTGPTSNGHCGGDRCLRRAAAELLRRIDGGDHELSRVNRRLGEWAIEGILATQHGVGTAHDLCLRESEVIATAGEAIDLAVGAGVCRRRPDGSVYLPVRDNDDAELTLLRRDGTPLVFSMLLGVYLTRARAYPGWQVLELTGEQWRPGRTAMYELLHRIGRSDISSTTEGVFFGMVTLGGRVMQSRNGSVVQADGLLRRLAGRVSAWRSGAAMMPAADDACHRLAVALLKYHVLRFPRADGFAFDEEAMWADATTRLGTVLQAFELCRSDNTIVASTEARALALALTRHSRVCDRALDRRDPSVLVRYVDDVAVRAVTVARRDGLSRSVATSLAHVLTTSLHLLGVDMADLPLEHLENARSVSAPTPVSGRA